ncbi:MAG: ABC transporter permease [Clostridium sp.]|nr:ABC transporter permease [Clostridium sp.]
MMNNSLFRKLAADNIKRNSKSYIPYIITCIVTVAIFYIVHSLSLNPYLEKVIGADTITTLMGYASFFAALFALAFLLYSNSFLVKRRKKEFAIFNVLGMEKSHIAKVIVWEILYTFLMSIAAGLILGIALDKVMFLLILKVIGGTIALGFFVSIKAIAVTFFLFALIFLAIYVYSVCQMRNSNPIELMQEGNAGEKEPKTNWLLAVLGVAFTGAGYLISIFMDKPLSKAIPYLFVAVMFVVIGTYMLFTSSSIALLKTLRKNKNYYYNTKHFISVSNLIYRMKQNAVGLANICILSTMVLIMVSSTSSLMLGMADILQREYQNDFDIYCNESDLSRREECLADILSFQKEQDLNKKMSLVIWLQTSAASMDLIPMQMSQSRKDFISY